MALKEPNFRFARQPPTIVTWAELHFYDLPLIRPSGFVNSAAFIASNRRRRIAENKFPGELLPNRSSSQQRLAAIVSRDLSQASSNKSPDEDCPHQGLFSLVTRTFLLRTYCLSVWFLADRGKHGHEQFGSKFLNAVCSPTVLRTLV